MKGENFAPKNGKVILSDGSIINIGDLFVSFLNGNSKFINDNMSITVYQKRHREIHQSNFFTFSKIFTVNSEDVYIFSFETGNKYIHLIPPILKPSGPNIEFYFYAGSTFANGSQENIICNNFVNPKISTVTIKSDVTLSTSGVLKYTDFAPGATGLGGRVQGGTTAEIEEFVLNKNTKHLGIIDNKDSNNDKMSAYFQWYESDFYND